MFKKEYKRILVNSQRQQCNMTISHKMTADIIVHSCHGTKRTFIMYFRRYEGGLLSYEMLDYKSTRKMYLKKKIDLSRYHDSFRTC